LFGGVLWLAAGSGLAQDPGAKLWEFAAGNRVNSSPAVALDGTIYFGSSTNLFALNPDGTCK